jgi:hypothetical protein
MVYRIIQQNKLVGFSYYPLIENALGVFFLFIVFFVPIYYFKFNGFKLQQWVDWLCLLIFFILFFFIGKNLAYQNMRVELKDNTISFMQDMRDPEVKLDISLTEWNGIETNIETLVDNSEYMHFIKIKKKSETVPFYQTRSKSEFDQMVDLLNKIYNENKGEVNGQK